MQVEEWPRFGPEKPDHFSDTLYISNIPPNANKIKLLLTHFKQFGYISSIWSKGSAAVIQFASEDSAIDAFKSPIPYAQNRFVKIFFHKSPKNSENLLSLGADLENVKKISTQSKEKYEIQMSKNQQIMDEIRKATESENINKDLLSVEESLIQLMKLSEELVAKAEENEFITPEEEAKRDKEFSDLKEMIIKQKELRERLKAKLAEIS